MLWCCFSVTRTEGLIRVEEKLNAPKYWDSLNENPVQSIQNLRRAKGSPSNRTMNLNTQKEWLIGNSVSGPARTWAWTQSNISGGAWKCASAPIQPERAWEVKKWGEEWQIMMTIKACRIIPKKIWGCNWCYNILLPQNIEQRLWTLMYMWSPFFILNTFAKISNKLLSHCHYGVLFVEFRGK